MFRPKIKEILNFHINCKRELKLNGVKLDHPDILQTNTGDLMTSLIERIKKRIGLQPNEELPTEDFQILFAACKFGYSLFNQSMWCSLFSDDELKFLEYQSDISSYYSSGYGRKINQRIPCLIISDLTRKAREAIKQDKILKRKNINAYKLKTYLYFSHSTAFKSLMSAFGLYKDSEQLKHEYCSENVGKRKWRSSLISPFGANFAAVLYRCRESPIGFNKPGYRLETYVQEMPVKIKGCFSSSCDIKDFLITYQPIIKPCDLTEICKI